MAKPFPLRESGILSLSELIARILGLLFLAHFVKGLGLAESAAFRTVLPLIGVAAALGSIGLPQALTRLFAAHQAALETGQQTKSRRSLAARSGTSAATWQKTASTASTAVPASLLLSALLAVLCTALLTICGLQALLAATSHPSINKEELHALLAMTAPLLLLMCATGSLRGILLGLGHTYAPALAQILEVGSRLLVLLALLPLVLEKGSLSAEPLPLAIGGLPLSGAQFGLLTLTVGEAAAGMFLGWMLMRSLRQRGVRVTPSAVFTRDKNTRSNTFTRHAAYTRGQNTRSTSSPFTSTRTAYPTLRRSLRPFFSILRMSLAPTGQALLASLGFALELPLAHEWLTQAHGEAAADRLIAEYAAIAIPLLCAPMVLTDGLSTALLPTVAAERSRSGRRELAQQTQKVIAAVALIALPATGAFFLLAPQLAAWFGSARAAPLLLLLAPLALPLYLQAPLSSLLQAQGYSRALLFAGLCGDAVRLGGLWLGLTVFHLTATGLALAFGASVLTQTLLLMALLLRLTPPAPAALGTSHTASRRP